MVAESVQRQLKQALQHSESLSQVVADYLQCVHTLRELQVRNAQLDREAGELRLENDTLLQAVEDAKRQAATSASPKEVEDAKARAAELQTELVEAFKEKSVASEGRAQAIEQLEVVREINAQQAASLEEATKERQRLLEEIRNLRSEGAKLAAARDLATKELETRSAAVQAAEIKSSGLEMENRDLVERLLSMKDDEIQRIEATSKMCEDMVVNAKRQASEIIASTRATIAQEASGAAALEESVRKLNMAAEAVGGGAIPAKVQKCLPGVHPGGCYALAMDSTGVTLASCGADRVVRLWDVPRCAVTAELRGAHEGVNDVAFTIDGKLVLGAEDKAAVRIWDCRTGRLINRALTGHTGKVTGVAASPADADIVVTASADRSLKLWKLSTGTFTRTIRFPSMARRVAILADTGLIVSGHIDGRIRFWDSRSPRPDPVKEIEIHPGREVFSVSPALAGGAVVTCGRDSSVCVVDTRRFSVRNRLSAQGYRVEHTPWSTPALSPAGAHVVAGSEDGSLFLWTLDGVNSSNTSSGVAGRGSNGGAEGSGIGANGSSSGGLPRILRQPRTAKKEQQDAAVIACAWSPSGMPVVSSDRLGGVTFWTADEPQEKK